MFNMAPHGKELSEDLRIIIVALHKDGRGQGSALRLFHSSAVAPYSVGVPYAGEGVPPTLNTT